MGECGVPPTSTHTHTHINAQGTMVALVGKLWCRSTFGPLPSPITSVFTSKPVPSPPPLPLHFILLPLFDRT